MKNFLIFIILLTCAIGAAYGQGRTIAQYQPVPFSQLTTALPDTSVRVCINCAANATTGTCESGVAQMVATKLDSVWKCTKFVPSESEGGVSSFNGRTGAVVPIADDYSFFQVGGVTQNKLLGRGATSSTGVIQQITIGSGLTLTGTTLTASGTAGADTALSNLASVAINTTLVSDTHNTDDLGTSGIKWRTGYFGTSVVSPNITFATSVYDSVGSGSPNGAVTANIGSTYRRTDGGSATTFYVKESGTGTNTGWVAAGTGSGTVTSIATTGPIGGGTITNTGTITCTTCVTSAAALTSTAVVTGAGSQGSQTPSATTTLDSSGNFVTPGTMTTGDGTVAGEERFSELLANGSDYVSFLAPDSVTTTQRLKLPAAANSAAQVLIFGAPSSTISTATWTSIPYDIAVNYDGAPAASSTFRFVAPRAFDTGASFVGTVCSAGTAATAQTDFLVKVNGTTKATLRFASSGTTCSIVGGTTTAIAATDVITIIAPASPDATLADIAITLIGTLH